MLYPVIMCGGAGARLWPASRTDRPKPFIPIAGDRPLFSRTLDRLRALQGAAPPLVIAGAPHAGLIASALKEAGMAADIVVEPVGRDSAPAMAAIAMMVRDRDPDGVCLFLAADHHIPDIAAFAEVVAQAAIQATQAGIVTLGIRPAAPSTAYGYIRSTPVEGRRVWPVVAFVEKPDLQRAAGLIADGCLWNSGIFISKASTLVEELEQHAPEVASAARAAVEELRLEGELHVLGESFRRAPKISIDFAVMERTDSCFVAPVDLEWSDLGSWDAIWRSAGRDFDGNSLAGAAVSDSSTNCLVQAAPGVTVAISGVRNLAIIAEPDRVMVCDMANGEVKDLVARAEQAGRRPAPDLADLTQRLTRWLDTSALPLWWTLGADHHHGGFHEALDLEGRPVACPRRLRVQARQIHVYARAGLSGWTGPWPQAVEHGLSYLEGAYLRRDGLYRALVDPRGKVLDDSALVYDQAFVLLALATAAGAGVDAATREAQAIRLLEQVNATFAHGPGGWRESGLKPFQANAHMHLLEACLAWAEVSDNEIWARTAGAVIDLALQSFVDPHGGFIREFFDEDWRPAPGAVGGVVEPGHQFEWAWLLVRGVKVRPRSDLLGVAHRLHAVGSRGIDSWRGVACDEIDSELRPARSTARLWPQTERIKAAVALTEHAADPAAMAAETVAAAAALLRYLDTDVTGLYRDQMSLSGDFRPEPSPASSLYHISGAIMALQRPGRDEGSASLDAAPAPHEAETPTKALAQRTAMA